MPQPYDSAGKIPLAALLKHVSKYYTEFQLKHDLDAVLSCASSEADKTEIRKFAKKLLAGKPRKIDGFESPRKIAAGKSPADSPARKIRAPSLKNIACETCGRNFTAKRCDARFCSARCRQKSARACHR